MLSKEHRLRRDRDFQNLFKNGEKAFSFPFSVRFADNKLAVSRFAVVVGTKVSKKAVERNYLRRQVREILRLRLTEIVAHKDVALSVQPQAKGMAYSDLEKALFKVLKKAGLLL